MNDENLTFVSASNFGSYWNPDEEGFLWGISVQEASALATSLGEPVPVIKTDFVGINSNIFEPVSSSTNTLGYPYLSVTTSGSSFSTNYINRAFVPGFVDVRGEPHYNETSGNGKGRGAILNAIILHRQGPYGWPSWKQVRVGNHPVNRVHRKNNIFSYVEKTSLQSTGYIFSYGTPAFPFVFAADPVSFNLTESCVSSKHKPMQHSFVVKQDGKLVNLDLKHSYGNLDEHYTNEKINIRLKFNGDFPEQFTKIYDDLKEIYIDKKFTFDFDDAGQFDGESLTEEEEKENPYGMNVPFKKWVNMTYTEDVFPKQQNTFLAKTRKRTEYAEVSGLGSNGIERNESNIRTFWKDTVADRNSLRVGGISAGVALNSLGEVVSDNRQSVWPLDNASTRAGNDQGEFGYPSLANSALVWAGSGSIGPYFSYGDSTATTVNPLVAPIPLYKTDVLSGKKPFFNSYEDFAEDIRGLGKDYSILPEFRISDHMQYYVEEKEGNFLANNPSFLSLNGSAITSSAETGFIADGTNENFFLEYSHSDFLKYFQKLADDHQEDGEVKSYTFSMKGIKKLLPYRGFYPILRVQQLATLFSQSFGRSDLLSGSSFTPLASSAGLTSPHAQRFNSFVQPFFAPGITFNTIKSALAVDFPAYVDVPASGGIASADAYPAYFTSGPSYRFPFESIIQPELYIPSTPIPTSSSPSAYEQRKIYWQQPAYVADGDPYAVWFGQHTQLYSLAANNFYGEIPKFFLKDQKLTDFISKPAAEWGQVEAGRTYYMDVVLKKTDDMILSEGQRFSGSASPYQYPPNRGIGYGPSLSSSFAWENHGGFPGRDPAYAAYTPPYFYDDCIARIAYTPAASGQPSLNDILSSVQVELSTSDTAPQNGLIFTGSFEGLQRTCTASKNKMQVTASVNLFGRSRYKKVNYSTNIGPDGNYIPTTLEDTDAFAFDAWSIGTKFECPALNFSASNGFHHPGGTDLNGTGSARGIFGGYGTTPSGTTGLYLEVKESFPEKLNAGDPLTGSLIRVCGFDSTRKKIGRPAQKKVISEAIIAIPFTYETHKPGNATTLKYPETDKKFFRIPVGTYKQALKQSQDGVPPEEAVAGGAGQTSAESIVDMINKMQKYNLPPQFDFFTFPELKPFVMYIFEFEHSLTQQDLTDIWQGLMPEISRTAQEDEVIVSHKAGSTEFFGGKRLPNTTRWMLFKVKRKAEKSYFAVTADSQDDQRFKFKFGNQEKAPEYSYNWPYDFFSLVELAKMDVDLEFTPKKKAFED